MQNSTELLNPWFLPLGWYEFHAGYVQLAKTVVILVRLHQPNVPIYVIGCRDDTSLYAKIKKNLFFKVGVPH